MEPAERDAMLALTLASGLGPTLTRRVLDHFGSAAHVIAANLSQLASVEGIGPHRAAAIRRALDQVHATDAVQRELQLIEQWGVTLLPLDNPRYPRLLKLIPDPPPLLYVRGELAAEDGLALAVIGSRKATRYGREQADRFAALCAQAGLTIVSGGAYGIDIAAHRAALRIGGRTIAVIGSGLAKPYPAQHADVFDEIAGRVSVSGDGDGEPRGAVISELPMMTPPVAENFPARNRLISGLALGVLVVEASTRSGARNTARQCVEDHNRELMALPGPVDSPTSAGCHLMIREGWATLVTSPAEVLDVLGEAGAALKAPLLADDEGHPRNAAAPSLFEQAMSESQQRIVAALAQPISIDELVSATGLPIHIIQSDLTMLQLRGAAMKEGTMWRRKK